MTVIQQKGTDLDISYWGDTISGSTLQNTNVHVVQVARTVQQKVALEPLFVVSA